MHTRTYTEKKSTWASDLQIIYDFSSCNFILRLITTAVMTNHLSFNHHISFIINLNVTTITIYILIKFYFQTWIICIFLFWFPITSISSFKSCSKTWTVDVSLVLVKLAVVTVPISSTVLHEHPGVHKFPFFLHLHRFFVHSLFLHPQPMFKYITFFWLLFIFSGVSQSNFISLSTHDQP